MSAIQQQSLPRVLGVGHAPNKNVVVQAQSGSGKTMSFTIGALCKIDRAVQSPQVLVLGPSRELAVQNYTECVRLTHQTEMVGGKVKIIPGPDGGERSRLTPPVGVGICVPVERGKRWAKSPPSTSPALSGL